MKAYLTHLFAYSLLPLMVILSGPCYGLDDEQIKRGRLLAGKFISQKKFDRADAVLKKLGEANDPPSLHLRALLILQRKVNGVSGEAMKLLCAASGFGYSKSSVALDKLGETCPSLDTASLDSSVPGDTSISGEGKVEVFADAWLKVAPEYGYWVLGNGSGVAINDKGHFLTNHHVVTDCPLPAVYYQGLKGLATVVFANEELDVAVLKVDAPTPYFARFDNKKYSLGENLYAAGYPIADRVGDDLKLSRGMLMSARDDERGNLPQGYLITDIPIGSGNSGGPVFTDYGLLRGLAVAILFTSQEFKDHGGRMTDDLTAVVSGLEILKYLDSRQNGLYTIHTGTKDELKSTEIAKLAEQVTVRVECIKYDKR